LSEQDIFAVNFAANGRMIRLGDIARVGPIPHSRFSGLTEKTASDYGSDCADCVLGSNGLRDHGGLAVATVLTLVFLPALYVAWYRIEKPSIDDRPNASDETTPAGDPEHAETLDERILETT
jgi:hypothetical protein